MYRLKFFFKIWLLNETGLAELPWKQHYPIIFQRRFKKTFWQVDIGIQFIPLDTIINNTNLCSAIVLWCTIQSWKPYMSCIIFAWRKQVLETNKFFSFSVFPPLSLHPPVSPSPSCSKVFSSMSFFPLNFFHCSLLFPFLSAFPFQGQ